MGGLLNSPLQGKSQYSVLGGQYEMLGYFVELCTIKKQNDTDYNSIELFIHNSFYGSQHGGLAHLYIGVSSFLVPKLVSKVSYPITDSFLIYTYFDGELLHLYAKVSGGNGVGLFNLFVGRKMGEPQLTFIGLQMKEIPSDAIQL